MEGVISAVIGGAVLLGIGALVGYFVKSNPTAHLEVWILVVAGLAACLLGGTLVALGSIGGGSGDAPLAKDREVVEKFRTTSAYTAHFRNTLASLLTGKLTISSDVSAWDDEVGRLLCEQPCTVIEGSTGHEPAISIWIEKTDQAAGERRFEIVLDENHSATQARKFATLTVDDTSWLHYTALRQKISPEDSPIAARNLADSADGFADIKMFKSMEYKEVRAFAVDLDGACLRFVALTKVPGGFTPTEDFFFLLLWCVFAIAAGRSLEPNQSDPAPTEYVE